MAIADTLVAKPPPLRLDQDGVLRVGGTRVTLDTLIEAYDEGAEPEQMALQYSLDLADVHAAISYYLRNRLDVDEYLERARQQAEEARRQNEIRSPMHGIRERLLARREQRE